MIRSRIRIALTMAAVLASGCRKAPPPDTSGASSDNSVEPRTSALTTLSRTGWTASASTTGGTNVAANAIDGSATTRWRAGAAQATNQWFQVDMGAPRTFVEIRLDTSGTATEFPRNFKVQVANNNTSWGTAPVLATVTGSSAVTTVAFASQTAQFIRVTLTGSNAAFWSIYELNVFGPALARTGWVATASVNNANAPLAIDTTAATRWNTGATTQVNGQFLQVDMTSPQTFNQITLDTGSSVTTQFPRGFSVTTSNDGTTFGAAIATGAGSGRMTVISFPTQQARFVRITLSLPMTVNTPWAVEDLNVHGQPTVPTAQVRSGWTATAMSNSANAGLAIDGSTATNWTSAGAQTNQWFQVDMGVLRTFTQIVVDTGTAVTPRTYQVQSSNNGMPPWTTVTSVSGTAATTTINVVAQTSRFIRINQTATSTSTWTIRELTVSGPALSQPGWVASASQTGGTDTADKAIDGVATTRWNSGVAQANGQTFQVDMGTAQVFNQLTLDAGTSTGNFPRGYSVAVSSNGTTWSSPVATGTGTTQFITINVLTQTARFLRITQTGSATNNWSIHELNIARIAQPCDTTACTPSDACHVAGVCDPATGVCSNPNAANGTTCNDNNACTPTSTCQAGTCTGANPVVCTASDACHVAGVCDPMTGVCSNPNAANGTTCNDNNACTPTSTCQAGTCTGANPVVCTASDACHVTGVCNPATGVCSNPNAPNGTACNDNNACTPTSTCQAGTCTGANPVACTASDACHVAGVCNPMTGVCSNPSAPNGTACNDNNVCTQTSTCQTGTCTGGNPVVCTASDACHSAGVCDPQTGVCSNPTLPGACTAGVFDYDNAGRLIRDRGAALEYDAYDQLRTVTPVLSLFSQLNHPPIENIGLPNASSMFARGMNARGDVVGYGVGTDSHLHSFLRTGSGPTQDLSATTGHANDNLYALAINDADVVAGMFLVAGTWHTYRYSAASGFEDLGPTASQPAPSSINDQGQIAGNFYPASGGSRGFRYTDGIGFEDIGTLPGGTAASAFSIDPAGTVFGSSRVADSPTTTFNSYGHAVRYRDVLGLQDLNELINPMLFQTLVTASRSSGDWVTGTTWDGARNLGYRLHLDTGALELVGNSDWSGNVYGVGINSFGEMAGEGYLDAGNTQKAVWIYTDAVGFRNLNELIDPALGWDLRSVVGINDGGDVAGYGYKNGVLSAFVVHLPLRQSTSGAPTAAVAHSYGYDGLRVATLTAPGTPGAATQVWFTQDYTETQGKREHYIRVGERIVAKVTLRPPPGGAAAMGLVRDARPRPVDRSNLAALVLLALLLAAGVVTVALRRKSKPAWLGAAAGLGLLFVGVSSCETVGTTRQSAATVWERTETRSFHYGIAAGPVLTTNVDGSLNEERRYEPFGQPVDANVAGDIGPVDFRREPQNSLGKLTDPATGWSYHGARWMQPQTARWTSPDPIAKGPSATHLTEFWRLNPYGYVNHSPTALWDPNGAHDWVIQTPTGAKPIEDIPEYVRNPLVMPSLQETVVMPDYGELAVNTIVLAPFRPVFMVLEAADPNAFEKLHPVKQYLRPFPYTDGQARLADAMEGTFTDMAATGVGLAAAADKAARGFGTAASRLGTLTPEPLGPTAARPVGQELSENMAPSFGPRSLGAGEIRRYVLQSTGNTIRPETARALNLTTAEARKAMHKLKPWAGVEGNYVGKIMSDGDYCTQEGEVLANIHDFVD